MSRAISSGTAKPEKKYRFFSQLYVSDPFGFAASIKKVQCTKLSAYSFHYFVQLFYDLVYQNINRYFSFHEPAIVKNEGEKEKQSGVYH